MDRGVQNQGNQVRISVRVILVIAAATKKIKSSWADPFRGRPHGARNGGGLKFSGDRIFGILVPPKIVGL
jgi:hypothetical protein